MKKWNKADYALLAAFGVFLLAVSARLSYPDNLASKLFLMTAEAALIGGAADWFAVTALFRRPLGFPYHTALVPRNRKRMIASLAKAVEEDFLSKDAIKKRFAATNLTEWLINVCQNIDRLAAKSFLRKIIFELMDKAVSALNAERAGQQGEKFLKKMLREELLATYLKKAVMWAVESGKVMFLYDFLLTELIKVISQPETRLKIYHYLENVKTNSTEGSWLSSLITWALEKTNSINTAEAADAIHTETLTALRSFQEDDHTARLWFLNQMSQTAKELADNTAWTEALETYKKGFLEKLDLASPLATVLASLQEMLSDPANEKQNELKNRAIDFLFEEAAKYLQIFAADAVMKAESEKFLQYLGTSLVESNHNLVGVVVKNALSKLTDEGLVSFVEEKAKADLTWIRLNGVIVGSIAGFLLGLFLHFVYNPFLNFL